MSGMRRLVLFVFLVGVVAAAGWMRFSWVAARTSTQRTIATVGRRLPSLPVTDESNTLVDLSQLVAGRRSVIVFYSSSCPACQSVLPRLQSLPAGLHLVLVAQGSGVSNADSGAAGPGWGLRLRDPDSSFRRAFPMTPVPAILFVDEEGVLRESLIGEGECAFLQTRLTAFAEASR